MKYFDHSVHISLITLIFSPHFVEGFVDPLSWGLTAVAGIGIYAGLNHLFACVHNECCTKDWITPNLQALDDALRSRLHGQHLVKDVMVKALKAHVRAKNPSKPLVLSLHGWTGGGKTYVSQMVAEHFFKEATKSKFVHMFSATIHFPHKHLVSKYQDDLSRWIRGNISVCEQSLFIFDEVDKMPSGVFDSIKPYLDYHDQIDGKNFRRAIYILLSNNGGNDITNIALKYWYAGKPREEISLQDLHQALTIEAFNANGGLHHSTVVESHLIDHFIPFLPLERGHVKKCVEDELARRNLPSNPYIVENVANKMHYDPPDVLLYSKSGCKRVEKLVAYELED